MAEATLQLNRATSSTRNLECPVCRQRAHQHVMTYPGRSLLFRNRTVARCVGCGLVYMYPMASSEALSSYYQRGQYWGHVSETTPFDIPTYHHQAKARTDFILAHQKFSGRTEVLDIGAGYGVLESHMKSKFPGSPIFHAIEPDPKAQESLETLGVRWSGDGAAFAEKKFDLIILSHVLEHVNDPVGFLQGIGKSCERDSTVFIEVPNEDFLFKFDLEPHVLFFGQRSLTMVLNAAGFDVVAIDVCGIKRDQQRRMNEHNINRMNWISKLPFRETLRKLKKNLTGTSAPVASPDPLSVHDNYDCDVYGDDRIWIRCIAKYSGAVRK